MRARETICDDCEVERTPLKDTTNAQHKRDVDGMIVRYTFADGWVRVPLAGLIDGIDICPKCDAKKSNLSKLAKKVRSRT